MKTQKLYSVKDRSTLFRVSPSRINKLLEFTSNTDVSVSEAVSRINPEDFYVVVGGCLGSRSPGRYERMAYIYRNGEMIGVSHPYGPTGWQSHTWETLLKEFPLPSTFEEESIGAFPIVGPIPSTVRLQEV